MKPPLHFHSKAFQERLVREGTREELIEWLAWNDPNGIYTDRDSAAEDKPLLTIDRARQIMHSQREQRQER